MSFLKNRVIFFLLDGARPDILNQELALGHLPNIARYLVEPGTNQSMVTVFPSTTGPAYLPFITGMHPGTCNIPGIRWFDKASYAKRGWSFKSFRSYVGLETYLMNHDLNPAIKTAYDIFNNPYSVMNMINRGVRKKNNTTRHSRIWYYYYAHLTDHWSFIDKATTRNIISIIKNKPDFDYIFAVYPSVDEYSHIGSPFHARTREAYRDFDSQVGEIVKSLKDKGLLEDTLFILTSDHGLSETKKHFDIGPFLETRGIRTFFYTQIFKTRFEAASMVSGNGMAHLYFKDNKKWEPGRISIEDLLQKGLLLDELRHREEIEFIAGVSTNGSIHILNDKGHGAFSIKNGQVHYEWKHQDPLNLKNPGNTQRKATFSLDESYALTWDSHTPDIFYQLSKIFESPRTGDLIVSARAGFDLRDRYEHPEHKSSHGALCSEHMKIPLITNIKIREGGVKRSMDIFPTLLQAVGKSIPSGLDGKSLI